jgi:hypothetical protein
MAVVIGMMFAGCHGDPTKPTFAIVGDSETNLVVCNHPAGSSSTCTSAQTNVGAGALARIMQGRYALRVRAADGQRIDQMLNDVRAFATASPTIMAVDLGTNDALQGNTNWQASFGQLLDVLLPLQCVVLTTVSEQTNYLDPTHAQVGQQINDAIASAQRAHPNVHVVDWKAAVNEQGTNFAADAFHPTTSAAQDWLATQYLEVADSCRNGQDPRIGQAR